ncbi:MAG: HAMP domain-containing protein [Elusimicrobia bacterium]|nr:HAMP domain-containing protein [Elusimicrobiota bacterium]MBD3411714.1 HAMP domain-containing protein [Elusimicrobiota bacterium]
MSMKMKLSLVSSLMVLLVIGSIITTLFFYDEKVLMDNQQDNQIVLFKSFVKICEDALLLDDTLVLLDFCSLVKQTNPSIIYILFQYAEGTVISAGDEQMVYFAINKLNSTGVKTPDGYLIRDVRGPRNERIVDLSMPIQLGNAVAGTAQMGFSSQVLENQLTSVLSSMRTTTLIVAFGAILLGIAASYLFAVHMIKPIKQLAEGAAKIGSGQLQHRIPVHSHDELGWLAGEFNTMGDKLLELDQMKNDFVSNVTHELRSPLGAIKSYSEVIDKSPELSPQTKSHLARIKSNVNRLSSFIDNLLDVSRIDQGKLSLAVGPVKLDLLATDVLKNFEEQARTQQIHLESRISSVLPPVLADKDKLDQILTNLVNNALKFTPAGGSVWIDAQEMSRSNAPHFSGRYIRVAVTDTGTGIAPNDIKRIFDKFEQARNQITEAHGTGLGLSIVKGLVEAHGGQIWINSRLGKGTTFYFTLKVPAQTPAGTQPAKGVGR